MTSMTVPSTQARDTANRLRRQNPGAYVLARPSALYGYHDIEVWED